MATPRTEKVYFPMLDWLRFSLASIVVLGHTNVISWHPAGGLAVQVFFALSGWLIGGILLKSTWSDFPRFLFNRATRVWIPYFLAVSAIYFVSVLREPISARWFEFFVYDLTFTHNLYFLKPSPEIALPLSPLQGTGNHFWSIAVEEQFYLFSPLLLMAGPWGRSIFLWIIISTVACLTQSWFGAISLGVLAAISHKTYPYFYRARLARICLGSIACLAMSVIVFTNLPDRLMAPFMAVSVVLLLANPGKTTAAGLLFGGLSYSLYLNQWMTSFLINGIFEGGSIFAKGISAYGTGVFLAALHYIIIDKAIHKHRNSYYSDKVGTYVRAIAYGSFATGLVYGFIKHGMPYLS